MDRQHTNSFNFKKIKLGDIRNLQLSSLKYFVFLSILNWYFNEAVFLWQVLRVYGNFWINKWKWKGKTFSIISFCCLYKLVGVIFTDFWTAKKSLNNKISHKKTQNDEKPQKPQNLKNFYKFKKIQKSKLKKTCIFPLKSHKIRSTQSINKNFTKFFHFLNHKKYKLENWFCRRKKVCLFALRQFFHRYFLQSYNCKSTKIWKIITKFGFFIAKNYTRKGIWG